jgi:hypothetical protein
MADPVIRLDRSKHFGENRGDMTPIDPHYKVAFTQGGKMGGKTIVLPFDVHGDLIPDDGRTEPFQGLNSDGKQITYQPLYDANMRAYLKAKLNRAAAVAAKQPDPNELEEDDEDKGLDGLDGGDEDEVNFAAWLKGEARYQPQVLRQAAKRRFSINYQKIVPDLVVDLVRDHNIVSEDELCSQFKEVLSKLDKALSQGSLGPLPQGRVDRHAE